MSAYRLAPAGAGQAAVSFTRYGRCDDFALSDTAAHLLSPQLAYGS